MRWNALLVALIGAAMATAACNTNAPDSRGEATVESPSTEEGGEAAEGAAEHVYDSEDAWGLVGAPTKGSTEALVTIVEFSEFQCPFCTRVRPTLDQILEEFDGQVRIVFKHLPLGFHDRAEPAARASMAAHQQGKFWEFHDLAFDNQRALTDENFIAWAEQLELDMDQFRADLENEELHARVAADAALAGELGIRGTPNFLINGQTVTGAQPFDNFAEVIRAEITAMEEAIEGGATRQEAYEARIEANRSAAAQQARQEPEQRRPARPQPDPNDELYVPVGQSPIIGPENALVTIVEFSEFQCPYCQRVGATLDQVVEEYGDQVRIVFKHNPLSFHDRAEPAARAAIAAQNQGQFEAFHDLAFQNQRALTDENFIAWAEQLGLNIEQFQADMASEETAARIQEDQALARRLQAGGTPHFFVNGMRLRGAQPFASFQRVIDAEIEKANEAIAGGATLENVYETLQADANRGNARMITPPEPEGGAAAPTPSNDPVEINTDGFPALGADEPVVTMVEYSDYTCGYCRRFHNTIYEAIEGYEDRVRVVFKHFPRGADTIALAASAAHAQGQFWEFSDGVFEGNVRDRDGLIALANELGLNEAEFIATMDSPDTRTSVAAQKSEGQGFGVRGTPTWFLNGVRHVGAYDTARLRAAWDEAIETAE